MNEQTSTRVWIERVLSASQRAVLATEGARQPHASLVAITPLGLMRQLVFATYRDTRKYHNLALNGRVAVLMQGAAAGRHDPGDGIALTATGQANETQAALRDVLAQAHLQRHPDLAGFLGSADCAIFCVEVESYQVVRGIDDARAWSLAQLGMA